MGPQIAEDRECCKLSRRDEPLQLIAVSSGTMPTSEHYTLSLPDLRELNGRIVLVRSSRDHGNPPTARRGWIEVPAQAESVADASVVVEFPEMFSTQASHRTIPLNDASFARLMASERHGVFEFTIDDEQA